MDGERSAGKSRDYWVYRHPAYGLRAIRTGWSWPAFFFDWIWAWSRRLWGAGLLIICGYLAIHAVTAMGLRMTCGHGFSWLSTEIEFVENCSISSYVAAYVTALLLLGWKIEFGRIGNRLRAQNLELRGYGRIGLVQAASVDGAVAKGFEIDEANTSVPASEKGEESSPSAPADKRFANQMLLAAALASILAIPAIVVLYAQTAKPPELLLGVQRGRGDALKQAFFLGELGNEDAQLYLAWAYESGWGVKQDDDRAMKWKERSARNGDRVAMSELADAYWSGKHVEKDPPKAVAWYSKAADAGWDQARDTLGWIYTNAENGIELNYAEAFRRFGQAASLYDLPGSDFEYQCHHGCLGLGTLYWKGLGVAKDAGKAVRYLKMAANGDSGDGEAEFILALVYLRGDGMPQDFDESRKWLRSSAIKGYAQAKATFVLLENNACMGPNDRDAGSKAVECAAARVREDREFVATRELALTTKRLKALTDLVEKSR